MPEPTENKGTQKESVVSSLNNPEVDKARAEKVADLHTGDEILKASDRDSLFKKYREFEKKELKDMGVDADKLSEELDALGEDEEKPEGEEEEHELEADEVESEEKPAEEPEGEVVAAEKETVEKEVAKPEPQGLTVEAVLAAKVPIKIDGFEGEVTVEDMRKSYQLQGHLTRQLQDVARQRTMLEQTAATLAAQRTAMENEFKEYENQLFSPEEIKERDRRREQQAREQQGTYQNLFLQCRNTLYSRHADVDQLDHDSDFVEWRQKNAPMVNEQLLEQYGPGVFFPAVDLLLTSYKEIKRLEKELKANTDTAAQLKEERKKELTEREAQQRAGKLKTAKDAKPSTTRTDAGSDVSSPPDGGKGYVRKMKEHRYRLQGLTPKSP